MIKKKMPESFIEFLSLLSNNKLITDFTNQLISLPSEEDNYFISIGDRWCSVENIVKRDLNFSKQLDSFAFEDLDPNFSFSSGNLKAIYLPDEDFINGGSAIIIFSIVGSTWRHIVPLENQLSLWEQLGLLN
ncbi:hypothetical protein [Pseudoalteromonas sp. TB64]|uniref:hypothetical protein n=1 Tax=Pseudoalteromonas sp. TB64 TaxID=1938600 RepID=UPI00111158F1|nr:hypothetical protein [Pseudoalteromonas sp. TB64]